VKFVDQSLWSSPKHPLIVPFLTPTNLDKVRVLLTYKFVYRLNFIGCRASPLHTAWLSSAGRAGLEMAPWPGPMGFLPVLCRAQARSSYAAHRAIHASVSFTSSVSGSIQLIGRGDVRGDSKISVIFVERSKWTTHCRVKYLVSLLHIPCHGSVNCLKLIEQFVQKL
jgi:hypothetical protein